jgi:hypothetical protein
MFLLDQILTFRYAKDAFHCYWQPIHSDEDFSIFLLLLALQVGTCRERVRNIPRQTLAAFAAPDPSVRSETPQ